MESYSFRECNLTTLDRIFGLREVLSNLILDQWLDAQIELDEKEKILLQDLQALLRLNDKGWNEHELSMHFIGPLFSLIGFTEPYQYNLFSQREISAVLTGVNGDVELHGKPDGMIATGYREPEVPFFAFSEYKRQTDPNGDPAGQALAAMLAGQKLNDDEQPIYGAYVTGSYWRFMILDGTHYSISSDYSALTEKIFEIFRTLKALKQIVIKRTA